MYVAPKAFCDIENMEEIVLKRIFQILIYSYWQQSFLSCLL